MGLLSLCCQRVILEPGQQFFIHSPSPSHSQPASEDSFFWQSEIWLCQSSHLLHIWCNNIVFSVPWHSFRVFQIFSHIFLSNTVRYRFYRDFHQAKLNFLSFELHRFSFIEGGNHNYLFTHLVFCLLPLQTFFKTILQQDSVTVTGSSLKVDSKHMANNI